MYNAQYQANLAVQDTSRGPSSSIWADCPIEDIRQGLGASNVLTGMLVEDDFTMCAIPTLAAASGMGQWACFADSAATFLDANEEGGVVILCPTSTSGTQVTLASRAGAFRMVSGGTGFPPGQRLWFECRVAVGSITSAVQGAFIGLADNTSPLTNAHQVLLASTGNTLATTCGCFGFMQRSTTSPADWAIAYQKAAGSTIFPTGLQTLVNTITAANMAIYAAVANGNGTGFVKLGFTLDWGVDNPGIPVATASGDGTLTQTAGAVIRPVIQIFVNGQRLPAFLDPTLIQTTRFPPTRMTPVIIVGGGTSVGVTSQLFVDWIRCAQLGSF